MSSTYSCKAKELRKYVKQNGYALTTPASVFLIVIDDIIKQLMDDNEFQKIFSN
ncbi:MAG: hypothetical protein GW876_13505 [Bacteroidetes bacterium]|nr:hypothetical protein [Bacteroidota bacterium]